LQRHVLKQNLRPVSLADIGNRKNEAPTISHAAGGGKGVGAENAKC
jgi:hypothetical protein